jgi:hypothetical protein
MKQGICDGLAKKLAIFDFFLLRVLIVGPRYGFTEATVVLRTGWGGVEARLMWFGVLLLVLDWRWGWAARLGKIGALLIFLSSCSLTLMMMKGYVGGLGASAPDRSISAL